MAEITAGTKQYLLGTKDSDVCKTRIGPDFQALIPKRMDNIYDEIQMPMTDKLLWNPFKIPENEVNDYLASIRPFGYHGADEEKALYMLHQCDYNREEATRRHKLLPRVMNVSTSWSEDECRRFEDALHKHGKDFTLVQKMVRTRSVEDIVEFYYFWKKTERYDVFMNLFSEKSVFGKSKFRKKARKKAYKTLEHADAILDEEQLPFDDHALGISSMLSLLPVT